MNTQNINWPKFWTALSAALMSALTMLAALPYTLGEVAEIIPTEWKPRLTLIGIIATTILRVVYGVIPTKPTESKQ